MVFVDETGIADNEVPAYGWAHSGVRAFGDTRGGRRGRVSIVGSLKGGQLHSGMILNGTFNAQAFEEFVEKILLPRCSPGDVIVMDNARIHKSQKLHEIVAAVGCRVLYQPKYSPDLNPIEHQWSPLKKEIRTSIDQDIKQDFCLFEKASEIMRLRLP